jgi:nucleoid DNA-binding protein
MASETDILQRSAAALGLSLEQMTVFLDALRRSVHGTLRKGEAVELMKFGVLRHDDDGRITFDPHPSLLTRAEEQE